MVLYFTGTGNSRYLAGRIADALNMPRYDLNACIKAGDTTPVQTGRVLGLTIALIQMNRKSVALCYHNCWKSVRL